MKYSSLMLVRIRENSSGCGLWLQQMNNIHILQKDNRRESDYDEDDGRG